MHVAVLAINIVKPGEFNLFFILEIISYDAQTEYYQMPKMNYFVKPKFLKSLSNMPKIKTKSIIANHGHKTDLK